MGWERFEERKPKETTFFMVTLRVAPGRPVAYLSFNKLLIRQVIKRQTWCDLFFDRDAKRIGVRFLGGATDINSYRINIYNGSDGTFRAQARTCVQSFLKACDLSRRLEGRTYHAALKHDPAEQMWWFDVAPLFNGGASGFASREERKT
jgi:hypothetical protein